MSWPLICPCELDLPLEVTNVVLLILLLCLSTLLGSLREWIERRLLIPATNSLNFPAERGASQWQAK